MLGNLCSDWLKTSICQILTASIGKNYSDMLPATSWEWASTVHERCLPSYLGYFMFRLGSGIHSSDNGSLYCETLQQHAPCRILEMIVNRASRIFSFASWVIYVPIGCRHPFNRFWLPLLGETTVTCSLPHPENERQQSVNDFKLWVMGNFFSDCLQISIDQILAAFTGKNNSYMLPAASWTSASTERQQF